MVSKSARLIINWREIRVSKSIGLAYSFWEGLIHGGVHFRNLTVSCIVRQRSKKTYQ